MSQLAELQAAKSKEDIASLLGYKTKSISYILYIIKDKYTDFKIPKKTGGEREISAPVAQLKKLQKRLSDLLQNCIEEINNKKNISSSISHGFRRRRSIITNASSHRNRKFVFNLDLVDFFGTINFGRVRGYFIANNNFKLDKNVATILAQIACYNNSLPQGSPSSPVISNLIAHPLDINLAKLASEYNCYYTRYADDLTFSSNEKIFPKEIAIETATNVWKAGSKLEDIIKKNGFEINRSKTRMQYFYSRQDVTGLITNKIVNVRKEYWRNARAMANSLFKTGEFKLKKFKIDKKRKNIYGEYKGTIRELNGILSFINSVDEYNDLKEGKKITKDENFGPRQKTYKRFLFFKHFYFNESPTIICEGKTDNVYIKYAIYNMAKSYPKLCIYKKGSPVRLSIQLFKYTKTSEKILGLAGGIGHFYNFIGNYHKYCKYYTAKGMTKPVIILTDNDNAAEKLINSFNKISTKKIIGSIPYYHINNNLYIFPIPKILGKDTVIEQYFDKSTRSKKIRGKKFNPNKHGFNSETEYGKHYFAEIIIKKEYKSIDFKKFKVILDTITKIIERHEI